jgi:hypothetical protein
MLTRSLWPASALDIEPLDCSDFASRDLLDPHSNASAISASRVRPPGSYLLATPGFEHLCSVVMMAVGPSLTCGRLAY